MNILYLYAELMPYQIVVFEELIKTYSVNIVAVHWDKNKLTPYKLPDMDGVTYTPKSNFETKEALLDYAGKIDPIIIYCSGWMDSMYNYVAKNMKSKGIPVIAGSDTQWRGGKQWLNVISARFRHKKMFSHLWVAGPRQYHYAKKLSFDDEHIILNSLTANTSLLRKYGSRNIEQKCLPHSFVFIGRLDPVKGLNYLIDAYLKYREEGGDWELICIGNGKLKDKLESCGIKVLDFMKQEDFAELSYQFGVFILPSIFEPWGVVLHEAACLGMPIISSSICGANSMFLINGFNGYISEPQSSDSIFSNMINITRMDDDSLFRFRRNSYDLSERINPKLTAASLMSVLGE